MHWITQEDLVENLKAYSSDAERSLRELDEFLGFMRKFILYTGHNPDNAIPTRLKTHEFIGAGHCLRCLLTSLSTCMPVEQRDTRESLKS